MSGVYPLINLTADKDNYYLRAEIPGLQSDELDIQVAGNSITLAGERKIPTQDENAKYHRREREAGRFSRGISLPGDVNPDKVEASLKDGVLTVIIPKAEAAKPKQISVK
jgi:HSP20 family protein